MTAKQYLQQIKVLDIRIRILAEEIEEQFTLATRVTPVLEKLNVQSSAGNAKEEAILKYIESTVRLDSLLKVAESQRAAILQQVLTLEDQRFIDIIYKRYFQFETWDDICDETHISRRNIFNLHGEALKCFERKCLH